MRGNSLGSQSILYYTRVVHARRAVLSCRSRAGWRLDGMPGGVPKRGGSYTGSPNQPTAARYPQPTLHLQGLPAAALPPALTSGNGTAPDGVSLSWKQRRLQALVFQVRLSCGVSGLLPDG